MITIRKREDHKFHRQALSVDEARKTILQQVRSTETVDIELLNSIGRRLAEEVRAKDPIPHFRRSGMDGFAVRSEDIAHASASEPVELEIIEEIPCGQERVQHIVAGKASRIMTGGMVPGGADAVIMLEMTEEIGRGDLTFIKVRKPVARGTNITQVGEEAKTGALLLGKGEVIGAGQMALLAALGRSHVHVFEKPKVAIICTGTELLQVSEPLQQGKIRNSNAYMLSAQICSAGGEPVLAGQIPDEYARAERRIYELLSSDIDLVVSTGGVSVGDYDIMADFFARWEGTTLFNKVAMRPGSPTSAGLWQNKLLFALSGNPSACYVGFELFVRPVLSSMQASAEVTALEHTAFLAEDYLKVNAYARYVRGVWFSEKGMIYVRPVGTDKSSAVVTIKDANCLIVVPPTKTGIRAGDIVKFLPLEGAMVP